MKSNEEKWVGIKIRLKIRICKEKKSNEKWIGNTEIKIRIKILI